MTKNGLSSKLERDRNRKVIYLLRNARTLSPREVFQLTPECAMIAAVNKWSATGTLNRFDSCRE